MHKTLKNWWAVRSGAGMTVYGEDAQTSQIKKITNVATIRPTIEPGAVFVVAEDKKGDQHRLYL